LPQFSLKTMKKNNMIKSTKKKETMTIKPISKNNVILQKGDKCIFEPEKKNYINLEANQKIIIDRVFNNGVVSVDNNSGIFTNVYANQLNKI